MRRSVLIALLSVSCGEPFTPRSAVATLDDAGTDSFIAVSAGREHTCALIADGSAYCWGSNEFDQLGLDNDGTKCLREDRQIPCRVQPAPVVGGLRFQKVRAGAHHTCGLGVDYRIYCWGDNLRGALGDPGIAQSAMPVPVVSNALFMDLAVGTTHSCGLRTDGVLLCWGANDMGQLGIGSNSVGSTFPVPVATLTSQRFASVAAGERRSCARTSGGAVYCWGRTYTVEVTDETRRIQAVPLRVSLDTLFGSVAVGTNTTCGVSLENQAFCWESNLAGGIGDGGGVGSTAPIAVSTTESFVAISSGATQTCAVSTNGFAYCWGGNDRGQLGISPALLTLRCSVGGQRIPCSTTPVRVSGWRVFAEVTAGQGEHVCGLTFSGNIYCWGSGSMGQRGDGRTTSAEWSPAKTRPI